MKEIDADVVVASGQLVITSTDDDLRCIDVGDVDEIRNRLDDDFAEKLFD